MSVGSLLSRLWLLVALGAAAGLFLSTPATSRAATAGPGPAPFTRELLVDLNDARAAAGAPLLTESAELTDVATARALDMASAGYFSHFNAAGIGAEWLLREQRIPFDLVGENIARSNYAPDEVVGVVHRALMASPGHRANALDTRFGRVGIGIAVAGDMYYFVQVFAD